MNHNVNQKLQDTFMKACEAFPDMPSRARPINMGCFGLVIDNGDNTVTKAIFRHKNEYKHKLAIAYLDNEVAALQRLPHEALPDITMPVLLEKQCQTSHQSFIASYRMTKVPGQALTWYRDKDYQNHDDQNGSALPMRRIPNITKHFNDAGKTLARFHQALADIPSAGLAPHPYGFTEHISISPHLSDKENLALTRANHYLQEHKTPGILHGDFHGGNIMVTRRGSQYPITGIIDMAMMGPSSNHLTDFLPVPCRHVDAFMAGYEQVSGQKIDRTLFYATMTGTWAGQLQHISAEDQGGMDHARSKIKNYLNKMKNITGMTL